MSVKIATISCETTVGVTVQHLFFHDENHKKLLIVIPGQDYTTEHPALYYLRACALQENYDVLSTQYSFQAAPHQVSANEVLGGPLRQEITAAIKALPHHDYAEISIAGKSLGSPYALAIAQEYGTPQTRLLLLTPVSNEAEQSTVYPTLCIIGTDDFFYRSNTQIVQMGGKNVYWRVYENLNHGLEVEGDWACSLAALENIIRTCSNFLRDGHLHDNHHPLESSH